MEINVQVAVFVTLGFFTDLFECFVTLSPFGAAQACVGQQLEFTCTTNETFLVWNFVPPLINHQGVSIPQDWFIASRDMSQQIQTLTVNSTLFTFMRTSSRYSSSLVSTLTIINSSSAINMAVVSCTEIVGNERAMSALTTIHVIGDTHTDNLSPPEVNIIPTFEMNSVSVTLEWTPKNGVSYSVAADRVTVMDFRFIQRTIVNLTITYSTPTNVTITATSCGQNSKATITSLELAYGQCADPSLSIADSLILVVGYDNLALSGTVVTFSCSPGVVLTGPNSSICMENGQWEPDPRGVGCTEIPLCRIPSSSPDGYIIPYNSTDDRIRVTFACQSNCGGDNLLTVIVASMATVFLVFSIVIFIVGFVCGQWCGQKLKTPLNQASDVHHLPVPVYESVLRDTMHEEQVIVLGENVAYGPST